MPNIEQGRVKPTPAHDTVNLFVSESRQPPDLAHSLVVLSGAHGFATYVAAARNASQKGARYVPEEGLGVIVPARVQ